MMCGKERECGGQPLMEELICFRNCREEKRQEDDPQECDKSSLEVENTPAPWNYLLLSRSRSCPERNGKVIFSDLLLQCFFHKINVEME